MRIERLRAKYQIDVRFVHFPLHPDTPEEGMTLEELFAGRNIDIPAAKERMVRLMATEGLPYGDRSMTYNSRLAQEMAKWAETQQTEGNVHDALFQAYFVDGANLAKIDNLVSVAVRLGLSADEARDILTTRRFREAVDADWQRSRQWGVTGVPTFVIGEGRLVGAQPYESLEQLVLDAGAETRSTMTS